jgi:hypothetical protein
MKQAAIPVNGAGTAGLYGGPYSGYMISLDLNA